jgi:hypothetical protein
MGEMCDNSSGKRYISTVHVLTCFVIFVYDPLTKRSFGAHIHMGAILSSIGEKQAFPEMVPHLAPFRSGCVVYVAGGHRCADTTNPAMQRRRDNSLSKYILKFVKSHLPLALLSTDLLLKFDGFPIWSVKDEERCCRAGHRYEILTLDTTNGHVTWDSGQCFLPRCDENVYVRQQSIFREMLPTRGICRLKSV